MKFLSVKNLTFLYFWHIILQFFVNFRPFNLRWILLIRFFENCQIFFLDLCHLKKIATLREVRKIILYSFLGFLFIPDLRRRIYNLIYKLSSQKIIPLLFLVLFDINRFLTLLLLDLFISIIPQSGEIIQILI
jgi:hypothetical protein